MPALPFAKEPTRLQREQAVRAGHASGLNDEKLDRNPYWPADPRHVDWLNGYRRGAGEFAQHLGIPANFTPSTAWPQKRAVLA